MIWKKGLLFLLLLLAFVPFLFSQEENPEEMTTQEILNELIEITNQERIDLQIERTDWEKEKKKEKADLMQERSELQDEKNSWQSYKKEMEQKIKSEFWKGFLIGGGIGIFLGGTGGIYLGINIRL